MDQDATWYGGRSWLVQAALCYRGPSSPPEKGGSPPPFSAHVYSGQTAGWIKMPLGMEVGLGAGHTVRWGSSSHSPKGAQPPIFGPYLLWPNGWMDQDATWWGGRPRSKQHCVKWGPSSPTSPQKGHSSPSLFSAHVYCGHGRPSQLLLS